MITFDNGDPAGMRIAVAMSGGVDSSVVAAALKERGYDVVGLTMALHGFSSIDAVADAQKVAEKIGIPHRVFDLTEIFSKEIIDDFADTYARGETPLPCARCNKIVKFGVLAAHAKELGAQALATGHYARLVRRDDGPELHRAADLEKDQSYFLFLASREELGYLRFPLGDVVNKTEIRQWAEARELPVALKPDSQDICFVSDCDYAGLVGRLRPDALCPGDIADVDGNVLGGHDGIVRYTVGQRRGLNLSDRKGEENEPLYVLRLDAARRRVIVGPREKLAQTEVFLRGVNWIGDSAPSDDLRVEVKLRSTQNPVAASFRMLGGGRGRLTLDAPAFGVAPGQAGVVYSGARVLGGGWIEGTVT